MPDWWEEFSQKQWMQIPIGHVLAYATAFITATVMLYRRLPAIKAGVINTYTFVTIVPTVRKIGDKIERIREQVENSHTTNLRDELDDDREEARRRHSELLDTLKGMRYDIGRLDLKDIERGKDIRALSQKIDDHLEWSHEWVRDVEETDRNHASRLGDLEDTLTPKEEEQ